MKTGVFGYITHRLKSAALAQQKANEIESDGCRRVVYCARFTVAQCDFIWAYFSEEQLGEQPAKRVARKRRKRRQLKRYAYPWKIA